MFWRRQTNPDVDLCWWVKLLWILWYDSPGMPWHFFSSQVESVMERVVLFLLSQVIFGILERPLKDDLYFSSYSVWEHGKILWHNGEAVGFYTSKKRGNLFFWHLLVIAWSHCNKSDSSMLLLYLENKVFFLFLLGSLCDGYTGQSYQLPVLDTVFVRCHSRRTGLALQMLEDFCLSQPTEGILGISFPMSTGMYGG